MNRKLWILLLGIALPILFCSSLAVCGMLGVFWWRTTSLQAAEPVSSTTPEPTPTFSPNQDPPHLAERRTAYIAAKMQIPDRDLADLARRLQGIRLEPGFAESAKAPTYTLGDRETFWLHNVNANSFFTATANLAYETAHAYWWVEDGYQVHPRDLERSAQNFEEHTYPNSRRAFGSEWTPGIDGDSHIYIFLGDVPGVGGYYSGPDEYPSQVRPHSNEHEMFYINLDNARPGNDYFDGILAHEFQHMIHWAMDRDEDTWVNEGLSELAAQINGYDVGGSDRLFTAEPDTQLTTWPELEDSGAHYGASYLFLAYFLERYGTDAVRQLVLHPANGIAGFDAVLARVESTGPQFTELFSDWVIANYLDKPDLEQGRYGYQDLRIEQPAHSAHHTVYPVRERATVHQYATDYVLLESEKPLTIEFRGNLLVPLVGNEAHSGEYQWWSNRGDEGDATLTRGFDLSGLEKATLEAWMWYDLETDYDYAYAQVSEDDGQTWDLLSNEHTTTTNPNGNSYGPGFTGLSGDGDEARWVRETFDLTPYAGQRILIRFEVVTDDTVNHPGLCLDDLSIPELGYRTDVEKGPGGWLARGWVRVTDHIPQGFVVQVITLGADPRVERMVLDEQMQGSLTLPGMGQDADRVVLAISAVAPSTTERATYVYQIAEE